MKKGVMLLSLAMLGACERGEPVADCMEKERDQGMGCYHVYLPVCGCNGKTYGNDCEALSVGITRFTAGKCK